MMSHLIYKWKNKVINRLRISQARHHPTQVCAMSSLTFRNASTSINKDNYPYLLDKVKCLHTCYNSDGAQINAITTCTLQHPALTFPLNTPI